MTTFNKSSLQNIWINGFVPQGSDYTNLIQSQVNIAETAEQDMAGALSTTELITPKVSATTGHFTTVSGTSFYGTNGSFSGGSFNVSANNAMSLQTSVGNVVIGTDVGNLTTNATNNNINGTNVNIAANSILLSANNITLNADTGSITTSANTSMTQNANINMTLNTGINMTLNAGVNITLSAQNSILLNTKVILPVAIISAAGTAQATGSLCSASICRLKGVVDGQTTGFALMPNRAGWTQSLYSDSVSANLWPPTGGTINALGANAVFPLAANTLYSVIHLAASAYAVK